MRVDSYWFKYLFAHTIVAVYEKKVHDNSFEFITLFAGLFAIQSKPAR